MKAQPQQVRVGASQLGMFIEPFSGMDLSLPLHYKLFQACEGDSENQLLLANI